MNKQIHYVHQGNGFDQSTHCSLSAQKLIVTLASIIESLNRITTNKLAKVDKNKYRPAYVAPYQTINVATCQHAIRQLESFKPTPAILDNPVIIWRRI